MKTFYIDVYFLINFTVDILALYFSTVLNRIKSTAARLILAGAFGAAMSCALILIAPEALGFLTVLMIGMAVTVEIFCPRETKLRKFKMLFAFLIFETLIGGTVNFIYGLLDTYLYPIVSEEKFGAENRKLLLLSLIVLLTYGILRLMFVAFNSSRSEKNVTVTLCIDGKKEKVSALVDSGCFLCDPLDGKPVLIVKSGLIELTKNLGNITESPNENIKKRLRVIPVKSLGAERILLGIRSDFIQIEGKSEKYENTVIALDNEGGSFGGYMAIAPLSLIE